MTATLDSMMTSTPRPDRVSERAQDGPERAPERPRHDAGTRAPRAPDGPARGHPEGIPERWLSRTETAARAGVTERTVDRWISEGLLTRRKQGRKTVVQESELMSFLDPGGGGKLCEGD